MKLLMFIFFIKRIIWEEDQEESIFTGAKVTKFINSLSWAQGSKLFLLLLILVLKAIKNLNQELEIRNQEFKNYKKTKVNPSMT